MSLGPADGKSDERRGSGRGWRAALASVLCCAALVLGDATSAAAQDGGPARLSVDEISKEIAEKGLSAVEASLTAKRTKTPRESFELAGVRFLRAIERASQERYRYDSAEIPVAPVLRLKLPKNPNPKPFEPAMVARVLERVLDDMDGVLRALDEIPEAVLDDPSFAVTLSFDDLWIDANDNGARDEAGGASETVMDVAGVALGVNMRGMAGTVVRFDASDLAWLRAYAHLLSGVSELALALDPTKAIEATRLGWQSAAKYRPSTTDYGLNEDLWIDQAATLLLMMRAEPDPTRTRAAWKHFDAMIANNRLFWAQVAEEKDDLGEWIPNPNQRSALGGVTVSEETVAAWAALLDDVKKVLEGELLLGHWRFATNDKGETVGVNLRKVLMEPRSADLVLWLQGAAAAPYLEEGETATWETWFAFDRLLEGRGTIFALWFN